MKTSTRRNLLYIIGSVNLIYVGLGWLGVVGGFSTSGSTTTLVLGALFILGGIASLWSVLDGREKDDRCLTPPTAEVISMAKAGDMISAIKEYRQQTGAGLKEAKAEIQKHLLTL